MKQIYVVGGNRSYVHWITGQETKKLEDADLVVFRGGADVVPSIYNDAKHPTTSYDGGRDAREVGMFVRALALDKKMLGICRGSQFLTVMNGGRLIQDVTNHAIAGQHELVMPDFGEGHITSTHHQMMYPYELPKENYEIIGHTPKPISQHYEIGNGFALQVDDDFVEPEIVFYPKTKSLGIQGHPERMNPLSPTIKLLREVVDTYLFNDE